MKKKTPGKKTSPPAPLPPGIVRLVREKVVNSTQTLARQLADADAPAWTLVWADRQTHGRGRMDRRWASGAGGLYISVVLRPHIRPTHLARLSLEAGKAAAEALAEATGLETRVEMPNDVLAKAAGGQFRKVCGILIEAAGDSRHIDWVVVGVGVNVNNKIPKNLPYAASLSELGGRPVEVERVLGCLLDRFRAAWG